MGITSTEAERRRTLVQQSETDVARWSDRGSFEPAWAARAALAAEFIPAGARVLDIGCGAMDLERALPAGCSYQPCDLVHRDDRTLVCDLNRGEFPEADGIDLVSFLGVLEYLGDAPAFLRRVRQLGVPVVCSYSVSDRRPELDRAAQGWINSMSTAEFRQACSEAGLEVLHQTQIDPLQDLFKLVPTERVSRRPRSKRVLALSYYNDPNFGDRLGYHLVNQLVPASATVVHASVKPWGVPEGDFDLLLLGTGHSLNSATVQRPELHALIDRIPHTLGIFGTQYRYQYRELIDPKWIDQLLSKLTTWWARNEEDLLAFGGGRSNVRHLGDWLISAFPNAAPTLNRTLTVPAEIKEQNSPLDRVIQQIQAYRRVHSARIHPLLCALTSAEAVAYREQHEDPRGQVSGKFRSMLQDIFGRTYPEDKFFEVDRDAVRSYKVRVEGNVHALKQQVTTLLAD